ncbi:MAG: cytochrome P450 [Solirubrobacterales bacterium]
MRLARDPLSVLMPLYERFGPIFSIRALHVVETFMIGPEANRLITVTDRENFGWRDGEMGELIPLLGDGLLTTDGAYHDRAREILMPAFGAERIAAAVESIENETRRSISGWRRGGLVDIYRWSRTTALRIAMRALLGLDPDDQGAGATATRHFERALRYYGSDFHVRLLRGPGTPWSRTLSSKRALDRIVYREIAARRSQPPDDPSDVLAILTAAESPTGGRLSDLEIRDHLVTLLFAGHDTMTSTLSLLLYELARHPAERDRVIDEVADAGSIPAAALEGRLPALLRCLEETLRLYPPGWVGPRRNLREFEFEGVRVAAGSAVNYSSLMTHRLPELFPEPERFLPERFLPSARAKLPPGAYIPFGAGPRICIGKRFALIEAQVVAATVLRRFRPEALDSRPPQLRPMPTLGPREGLRLRLTRS